ncbi:MAG: hypothetical protein EBV53_11915, partial [Proteobacteria bacterium]|nr:hypothetical protein [Pseudomonadota bacterium]
MCEDVEDLGGHGTVITRAPVDVRRCHPSPLVSGQERFAANPTKGGTAELIPHHQLMIDNEATSTPATHTMGGGAPAPGTAVTPDSGPMQASRPGPVRSSSDSTRPRPPGPEGPRFRGAPPPKKDPEEEDPARRFMNLLRRPWIIVLVVLLVVNWLVTPYV